MHAPTAPETTHTNTSGYKPQEVLTVNGHPGAYWPRNAAPAICDEDEILLVRLDDETGGATNEELIAQRHEVRSWEPPHPEWCNDQRECQNTANAGQALHQGHVVADTIPAQQTEEWESEELRMLTSINQFQEWGPAGRAHVRLQIDGEAGQARLNLTPQQMTQLGQALQTAAKYVLEAKQNGYTNDRYFPTQKAV